MAKATKKKKVKSSSYTYDIGDTPIYIGGLYEMYQHTKVKILERTRTHQAEYYRVEFNDGEVRLIAGKALINEVKEGE